MGFGEGIAAGASAASKWVDAYNTAKKQREYDEAAQANANGPTELTPEQVMQQFGVDADTAAGVVQKVKADPAGATALLNSLQAGKLNLPTSPANAGAPGLASSPPGPQGTGAVTTPVPTPMIQTSALNTGTVPPAQGVGGNAPPAVPPAAAPAAPATGTTPNPFTTPAAPLMGAPPLLDASGAVAQPGQLPANAAPVPPAALVPPAPGTAPPPPPAVAAATPVPPLPSGAGTGLPAAPPGTPGTAMPPAAGDVGGAAAGTSASGAPSAAVPSTPGVVAPRRGTAGTTPATAFDQVASEVMDREGGYIANDAGKGATKFGVNQTANPDIDVKNLTRDGALDVYRKYWNQIGADNLSPDLQRAAMDAAINQGPGWTMGALARANGDLATFNTLRLQHYQNIAATDPGKRQFLPEWTKRVNDSGSPLPVTNAPVTQAPKQEALDTSTGKAEAADNLDKLTQLSDRTFIDPRTKFTVSQDGRVMMQGPQNDSDRFLNMARVAVKWGDAATAKEAMDAHMTAKAEEANTYVKNVMASNLNDDQKVAALAHGTGIQIYKSPDGQYIVPALSGAPDAQGQYRRMSASDVGAMAQQLSTQEGIKFLYGWQQKNQEAAAAATKEASEAKLRVAQGEYYSGRTGALLEKQRMIDETRLQEQAMKNAPKTGGGGGGGGGGGAPPAKQWEAVPGSEGKSLVTLPTDETDRNGNPVRESTYVTDIPSSLNPTGQNGQVRASEAGREKDILGQLASSDYAQGKNNHVYVTASVPSPIQLMANGQLGGRETADSGRFKFQAMGYNPASNKMEPVQMVNGQPVFPHVDPNNPEAGIQSANYETAKQANEQAKQYDMYMRRRFTGANAGPLQPEAGWQRNVRVAGALATPEYALNQPGGY